METYQVIAIIGVIIFLYFIFFKNKNSAQKEISSLSEIEYMGSSTMTFHKLCGSKSRGIAGSHCLVIY
jgi:cell division protease FtsH